MLQHNDCQTIAYDFHALGLNVIPIQEESKQPALQTFAWWLYDQQEADDIKRVIYNPHSDIAVIGGAASRNAFFLDCETPECFAEFSRVIGAQYGGHAAVTSKRGGHLWLRAPFPVKSRNFGEYEIKGQGNYVLAPPSTHPSGVKYRFASSNRNIPIISALPFVTLEPKFVPRISRFAHDLFRGRESREYHSRSERDQSFILSLVRSGFAPLDIAKFLSIAQFPSKYRALLLEDEKAAAQYLEFCIEKARAHPQSEQFLEARTIAAQWEEWALAEKWTGRTGAVDRAVFLAHLHCSYSAGSLTYNASVRQVAELAQTTAMTVSRANRRLTDLGILRLHEKSRDLNAASYSLAPEPPCTPEPAKTLHADNRTYHFMTKRNVKAGDPFASVWEQRGLGKTALLIWESLSTVKADYREIKEASGRGMRTVERWIPRLCKYGLIVKTERGYQQASKIDWVAISRQLSTQNIHAERVNRHQTERERFARLKLMLKE